MNSVDCHIMVVPPSEQRRSHELQSLLDCISIRERVFIDEQQVPIEIEQDGKEGESGHVLLWCEDTPVGTLRFRSTESGVKMERIAVLKAFRGRHLGRLLIREGVRAIRMNNCDQTIYIHAQKHAAPFYRSLGFRETGEETIEANIPHCTMLIDLEHEERLLETEVQVVP